MIICQVCGHIFSDSRWICPSCNSAPTRIDGFPAFAPNLAQASEGFRSEHFDDLAVLESNNFWFRSRNRLIAWAMGRYFDRARSVLEIGCGTGYVLSGLEQVFPDVDFYGSEVLSRGLEYAKKRASKSKLFQMDARDMPFTDEFDVIGAFDVLEHIAEDEQVLGQMYRAVRQGGGILLTVPQHPFLWSRADEHACHVRRYRAADLVDKVESAGFSLVRKTSFVAALLPLMALSRLRGRQSEEYDPQHELRIGGAANFVLEKILDAERLLIQAGVSFPVGGSLLVIAVKR